jgi:hypothetical protein
MTTIRPALPGECTDWRCDFCDRPFLDNAPIYKCFEDSREPPSAYNICEDCVNESKSWPIQVEYQSQDSQFEQALKNAFSGDKLKNIEAFIYLDPYQPQFLYEAINWALAEQYVCHDLEMSKKSSTSAFAILCYKLTDKGRRFIEGGV